MTTHMKNGRHESAHTKDMTKGNPYSLMLGFALPIFLSQVFQQMYNTADAFIVGRYLGTNALAAVTSSGTLIFLMISFFAGIAMGAGVVISRYFGAGDGQQVSRAIHTVLAFGLAAGVALTIAGVLVTPQILRWMGTPESVFPNSVLYFRIYFAGSLGFVMYNIFVGILQSIGDSRRPLMYLIISSVTNVALDLLFIAVMGMGVGAAAFATVLSQFASAVLCLSRLMRAKEEYRIVLKEIRFDRNMMRQIISNGFPAGVQNSIIALANVVVQSNINVFGMTAVAGCGAYSKIEGFGFLPITCFALSLTTFISQNLGAKEYGRAKKGAKFGIFCSIITAELVGIFIYIFIPYLVQAFDSNPEVIRYGTTQARTVTLFYFLLAFSHCLAGIFRGAGKSMVPMLVMLACWCVIRISYITIAVRIVPVIRTVFWAYPLTWSLSSVIFLVYFLKADWIHGFEGQAGA